MPDTEDMTAVADDTAAIGNDQDLPAGISWPADIDAETAKGIHKQIATQAIQDFVGVETWILFQFESPTSIRFGIQNSEPKPTNEVLVSVLGRIVRELETIHALEVAAQSPMGQAVLTIAAEVNKEPEGTLVDSQGIPVLKANREQKRHPEKYGLRRV